MGLAQRPERIVDRRATRPPPWPHVAQGDHMSAYATASAVTRHVRQEIPDCDCPEAVIFLALGLRAYIERNPDETPRSGLLGAVKASMRPVVRGVKGSQACEDAPRSDVDSCAGDGERA